MDSYAHSAYIASITKPYLVWFEEEWVHDNVLHTHHKGQLIYVESGFQYLTVNDKVFLLPQNHAAWIPPGATHKTNSHSEKIKLMVLFFEVDTDHAFYQQVNIFSVPTIMKEMIKYAGKWSMSKTEDMHETIFLHALFHELPQFAKHALQLHINLPHDPRLEGAVDYINQHYMEDMRMEDLSDKTHLSLRSLERIFKQETGLTLNKYHQLLRIIKSLELLSLKELTISEIAYKVGYKSLQAYTNSFYSVMKYRPSDFHNRHLSSLYL